MSVVVKTKGVGISLEPVPDDTYEIALTDVKVGPSKNTPGEFSYSLTLTVQTPADFAGRKLFYSGGLQEQSLFGMKRALVALGASEEVTEADQINVAEAFNDLRGKVAKVTTTIERQPGRDPQNRVRFIIEGEDSAATPAAAGGGKKKGNW